MAGHRPHAVGMSASGGGGNLTRQEVAEYIEALLAGLKSLAKESELGFLAYLISIAHEEAQAEKTRQG